jgi:hypothetical protein
MVHLNDIDLEMTTLCRCARSVPICRTIDAGFLNCATTLPTAFDWGRQPALRNIGFFSSNWLKDGVRWAGTQLVKVAPTVTRNGLSGGCGDSWRARPR